MVLTELSSELLFGTPVRLLVLSSQRVIKIKPGMFIVWKRSELFLLLMVVTLVDVSPAGLFTFLGTLIQVHEEENHNKTSFALLV